MVVRRLTIVLLAALTLAACGSSAPVGQLLGDATQSPLAAPTAAPVPTARATAAPVPTARATAAPRPTLVPSPPPAPAVASTQPAQALTQAPQPTAAFASELLFLRKGALIALNIGARAERRLADGVRDFAAAPDGQTIAFIGGEGRKTEIWLVRRDGGGLVQVTTNDRAEAALSWAPDGLALIYGSSTAAEPYRPEWAAWSAWCAGSEVRLLTLGDAREQSFGPGCDPAFSPDGKRIAYATPPAGASAEQGPGGAQNTIRLINRQGQNGWSFASADGGSGGAPGANGLLVYGPAWSRDGAQIIYHRFVGYQALVDIDLTEISGSFAGKGKLLSAGAGWLLPARFSPDGTTVAIAENNYSDARGFGGYDNWKVSVLRLDGAREIALPGGAFQAVGQQIATLPRAQTAAWSPDGAELAVVLPPGWSAQLSPNEPINAGETPGAIWRWRAGSQPEEQLATAVDFASPLAWLPAVPQAATAR